MRGVRWLVGLVAVAACGGASRETPAARPAAAPRLVAPPIALRDPAIPEPPPKQPPRRQAPVTRSPLVVGPGGNPLVDGVDTWIERETVVIQRPLRRFEPDAIGVAESEFWDRCVRDFVAARPEPVRRALSELLVRYAASCDADGRVVLERPLGPDGRARSARADIAFGGTLAANRVELALQLTLCEPLDLERVTLGVDGETAWASPRLEFHRDDRGCAVADIPMTRVLAAALTRLVDADHAWVRFESSGPRPQSETLAATDEQKRDLQLGLAAFDALCAR